VRGWLLVLALPLLLAGCETTQQTSARLQKQGKHAFTETGVKVASVSRSVRVLDTAVLHDANGAAVVVTLRNQTGKVLVAAPVAIVVKGKGGAAVFRNDAPGLEPALAHVASLAPGQRLDWVNDQVTADGTPTAVDARVGAGAAGGKLPKLTVGRPRVEVDAVNGPTAVGTVTNRSKIVQTGLVVFAVGRKAGKVVAAGRSLIPRLVPGKPAKYHVFFIGDPRGAKLTVTAPPTVLR
jgi:hypothetical protein